MSTYEKRQENRWQGLIYSVVGMVLMKYTGNPDDFLNGWIPGIYLIFILLIMFVAWSEHKWGK